MSLTVQKPGRAPDGTRLRMCAICCTMRPRELLAAAETAPGRGTVLWWDLCHGRCARTAGLEWDPTMRVWADVKEDTG